MARSTERLPDLGLGDGGGGHGGQCHGTRRWEIGAEKTPTTWVYFKLCAGCSTPYEELYRLFDRKTDQGANMAAFMPQLEQAVKSIQQTFRSRNAKQLQAGRGGLLVGRGEQPQDLGDFELITWLVLMAPE